MKWALGLAGAGAIAAILAAWLAPESGKALAVQTPSATHPALAAPPSLAQPRQPALPAATEEEPLSKQVQSLLDTHDPEKFFQAYRLLSDCEEFNKEHDLLMFDEKLLKRTGERGPLVGYRGMNEQEKQQASKRCSSMTERERQSRLDYLAIAAKAGVPGAAVSFAREGPFGDRSALKTRPNDPLVQEWRAQAVAQMISAAESGSELSVIQYVAVESSIGTELFDKNPRLAYRYNFATGLLIGELAGPEFAKPWEQDSELMRLLAKDLSPEERAAELAAAQQIANRFRERHKPSANQ